MTTMTDIEMPRASTPAAALRCAVVTDATELEALRPAWLELLHHSSANEPMLSPDWLLTWWDIYGKDAGRRLCVGCFYEGDRLVGLAPFQSRRVWYRRCVPFRRLEPLGADAEQRDGVYSEYLNLIVEKGKEPQVLSQLVLALLTGEFGRWHEIVVPVMDGDGQMPALLTAACAGAGLRTDVRQTEVSPYIPLPGSWDAYLKVLTKKDRRYVTQTLSRFDEWAAGKAEFHRARTPEQLEEGKAILRALHAERWQSSGKEGVFHATRFAAFHDRMMKQLLEAGALEMDWATVAGEPVAASYNVRWNGKIYFYQAGRKMDVPANLRLGVVMQLRGIRSAIESGCREYDFLAGSSQYKRQLSLAQRPLVEFRAVRPGPREAARRLVEHGVALVRRLRDKLKKKEMPKQEVKTEAET